MTGVVPLRLRVRAVGVALCLVAIPTWVLPAATVESVADCRDLVRDHPRELDAYRCFWVIARQHDLWQDAITGLETILAGDPGQPRAQLYLGMIQMDRSEPVAGTTLRTAADGFASEGEPTGEVYALLGLAHWLDRRERVAEAGEIRRRAAGVAATSGDPVLLARTTLARAWQAAREKDFAAARALFFEVEAAVFPDGPFDMQYGAVNGLGYTDWATGRYRSALHHYRRQAALCAAGGDRFEETSALYNAAFMASQIARTPVDIERIDDAARQALDAALRSGDRDLEARLRLMLAQPHDGSAARRGQALAGLEAARAAAIPELEIQAERHIALHDLALQPHDPAGPLKRLEGAVTLAMDADSLHEEISGRIVLSGALWLYGDRDESLRETTVVIDLIEGLRDRQSADEERARIASTWSHAFYQPIGRLLESGGRDDIERALRLMERLRAHDLIDLLEAADAPIGNRLSTPLLSLDTVQTALAENEALVSYQLADRVDLNGAYQGGSWAIVFTSQGAASCPLPDRREIDGAVEVYLGLVQSGDRREAAAAHRVFELILGPTGDRLSHDIDSLVVVPDGILAALPVAALRPDEGGPPLVDRATITVTPSITQWLGSRAPAHPDSGHGYLGIADPVLDPGVAAGPSLRWARDEVRRARRRLGDDGHTLTGEAATEAAVKASLREPYHLIHFATHAEVDRDDPSRTAILLGAGGAGEDGSLGIAEVSALDLDAPIVVLSACRSAGGVVLQGEGVIGLTRAFFAGGARTVVGNLWPVTDHNAARLTDRFIRHLSTGSSVAASLSSAQRDRWRAGDPTRAWAGLVVIGDGDAALAPGRGLRRWQRIVAAIAAITVIVIMLSWLRSRIG